MVQAAVQPYTLSGFGGLCVADSNTKRAVVVFYHKAAHKVGCDTCFGFTVPVEGMTFFGGHQAKVSVGHFFSYRPKATAWM
jgi:hypothetical protein